MKGRFNKQGYKQIRDIHNRQLDRQTFPFVLKHKQIAFTSAYQMFGSKIFEDLKEHFKAKSLKDLFKISGIRFDTAKHNGIRGLLVTSWKDQEVVRSALFLIRRKGEK